MIHISPWCCLENGHRDRTRIQEAFTAKKMARANMASPHAESSRDGVKWTIWRSLDSVDPGDHANRPWCGRLRKTKT